MTTEIKIDMANMPPLPPEAFDPIKDAMIEALTKGGAEWRERALVAEAQAADAAARIEALERELAEANADAERLAGLLDKAINGIWIDGHFDQAKTALAAHRARTEGKANG
ncbi:hypothetical protein [Pararhodobacter sp. CCB-MM2]|uniref:hypothetical protein n=1 Tax=Pararhodobacter sp. CCB-MM2 TaxID=1786003 RepID=UPI000835ABE5|nr:hypothetical protein [Pararhodobacter sp. CCB-MM2]